MARGEKLFSFLADLMLRRFYGTVTMRFEAGKATHVEVETRRVWRYQDLPDRAHQEQLSGRFDGDTPEAK